MSDFAISSGYLDKHKDSSVAVSLVYPGRY